MQTNKNYDNLEQSYLFSTIARKVREYSEAHPEADIIRLGIGDVTRPLVPAVIDALHAAVEDQASRRPSTATVMSRATASCTRRWSATTSPTA